MAVDLRRSSLTGHRALDEDVDPISGLANMSDAMLVLACGLLMALVLFYQVDLSAPPAAPAPEAAETVTSMEQAAADGVAEGSGYSRVGSVYLDEETGTMYMVKDEGAAVAEGSSAPE